MLLRAGFRHVEALAVEAPGQLPTLPRPKSGPSASKVYSASSSVLILYTHIFGMYEAIDIIIPDFVISNI